MQIHPLSSLLGRLHTEKQSAVPDGSRPPNQNWLNNVGLWKTPKGMLKSDKSVHNPRNGQWGWIKPKLTKKWWILTWCNRNTIHWACLSDNQHANGRSLVLKANENIHIHVCIASISDCHPHAPPEKSSCVMRLIIAVSGQGVHTYHYTDDLLRLSTVQLLPLLSTLARWGPLYLYDSGRICCTHTHCLKSCSCGPSHHYTTWSMHCNASKDNAMPSTAYQSKSEPDSVI